MKFIKDTRKEQIVKALLLNQRMIVIDKVEIFLKPLKRDTLQNREKEANQKANEILKLLL